jgi:hypothetical protein
MGSRSVSVVFDACGRALALVIDRQLGPGIYSRRFDAGAYPAGVDFARIEADGRTAVRRLVSVR